MKASEVVAALVELMARKGDLEVFQNSTHVDSIKGVDFHKGSRPFTDRIVLRNWGSK